MLALACGGDPASTDVAAEDTTEGATSEPAAEDTTWGDDDVPPPWDGSECAPSLSGMVEWSGTITTTAGRGGGRDLVRGPEETIYVLDGCISRWTELGIRSWQIFGSGLDCQAITLGADGQPVVAGGVSEVAIGGNDEKQATIVLGYDAEGLEQWRVEIDDVRDASQRATAVATDPNGDLIIAGLTTRQDGSVRAWVAKLDPRGALLWKRNLPAGTEVGPYLDVDAGGVIAVADQRRTPQGVPHVVITQIDTEGAERWTWDSAEELGYRMGLSAIAVDWRGGVVLGGRNEGEKGRPALLVTLGPEGRSHWVRSGSDIPWLETIHAVGFDPCDGIVIAGSGDLSEGRTFGQLWMAKLDRQGELRWASYLPAAVGLPDNAIAALRVEADGGVIATGTDLLSSGSDSPETPRTWLGRFAP